jgi:hypothetical protein
MDSPGKVSHRIVCRFHFVFSLQAMRMQSSELSFLFGAASFASSFKSYKDVEPCAKKNFQGSIVQDCYS